MAAPRGSCIPEECGPSDDPTDPAWLKIENPNTTSTMIWATATSPNVISTARSTSTSPAMIAIGSSSWSQPR